jgi:hypothetical protein
MLVQAAVDAALGEVTPRRGKGALGHGGGKESVLQDTVPEVSDAMTQPRNERQTWLTGGVCEQALKPPAAREGSLKKCHGRQPDSGKPTVRDDTGGLWKRDAKV